MATRSIGTDDANPRLPAVVIAATQGTTSADLAAGNTLAQANAYTDIKFATGGGGGGGSAEVVVTTRAAINTLANGEGLVAGDLFLISDELRTAGDGHRRRRVRQLRPGVHLSAGGTDRRRPHHRRGERVGRPSAWQLGDLRRRRLRRRRLYDDDVGAGRGVDRLQDPLRRRRLQPGHHPARLVRRRRRPPLHHPHQPRQDTGQRQPTLDRRRRRRLPRLFQLDGVRHLAGTGRRHQRRLPRRHHQGRWRPVPCRPVRRRQRIRRRGRHPLQALRHDVAGLQLVRHVERSDRREIGVRARVRQLLTREPGLGRHLRHAADGQRRCVADVVLERGTAAALLAGTERVQRPLRHLVRRRPRPHPPVGSQGDRLGRATTSTGHRTCGTAGTPPSPPAPTPSSRRATRCCGGYG